MEEIILVVASAVNLAYLFFIVWLRSDLIKIRSLGVRTAPNFIALVFLILAPMVSGILGGMTGRALYGLLNISYGHYGYAYSFSVMVGSLISFIIAGLAYYLYRLSLLRRISPDNPPLAPLSSRGEVLFWIIAVIHTLYLLGSYYLGFIF